MAATIAEPVASEAIYHGILGRVVNKMARFTEASREGTFASMLAAFSVIIGDNVKIISYGKQMPLLFWPVLIGDTGFGYKGTATDHAFAIINAAMAQFKSTYVKKGIPITGLRFLELIQGHMVEGRRSPLLFVETEMDDFLDAVKKNMSLGTNVRKAWDGDELSYETAANQIVIEDAHIAIIGHAQPDNWMTIRGGRQAKGGTFNRFLPIYTKRAQKLPVFGDQREYRQALKAVGQELRALITWAKMVDHIEVPEKVARRFEEYHRVELEEMVKAQPTLREFSQRGLAYVLRLAALYALSDMRQVLTVEDFTAALELVRYSMQSIAYIMTANRGGSYMSTTADRVWDALASGPVKRSELYKALGGNHISAEQIDNAILELGDRIRVYKLPAKGRGAPPTYVCRTEHLPAVDGITILNIGPEEPEPTIQEPAWKAEEGEIFEADVVEDEPVDLADAEPEESEPEPVRELPPAPKPEAKPSAPRKPRRPDAPTAPPTVLRPVQRPDHGPKAKPKRPAVKVSALSGLL